jgi:hypothetical protein
MSFIPSQDVIGQALSIAALVLASPSTFLFRTYSRSLDFAQMLYVFAAAYSTSTTVFSTNLNYSFLSFMSNFLTFCTSEDYVCTYGYLLSPALSWLAVALLSFLLAKLLSCINKQADYYKFYNFWRGVLRWVMAPLVYFSTGYLINFIQDKTIS